MRAAILPGTRCVILHAPDGGRIALTPAAARVSLAELAAAVADLEQRLEEAGGVARLSVPRHRIVAPGLQRWSRQWTARPPAWLSNCLLSAVLLAPLAWIAVVLPVIAVILAIGAQWARSAWLPVMVAGTVPVALAIAFVAGAVMAARPGKGPRPAGGAAIRLASG